MMHVYALDADRKLVTAAIPYVNMQWNRRYYEPGDFQMEVPLEVYDPSWAYIGVAGRRELAMVQKVEVSRDAASYALVSGFFMERKLDDRACYPRTHGYTTSTETAVRLIFDKYVEDDFPVQLGAANDPRIGDATRWDFTDDQLGTKLASILESREMAYRVDYDYEADELSFVVWQGKDRTQGQTENAWQTFSMDFGNLAAYDVNTDSSDYKNYAIIPCNEVEGVTQNVYYLDLTGGGERREIVVNMRSSRPEEGQSAEDFREAMIQEALERLTDLAVVEDVDATPIDMGGYMTEYDLGDKCTVELSDVGISIEARIVEAFEVSKESGHTVELGFGNKRISNIRRMTA